MDVPDWLDKDINASGSLTQVKMILHLHKVRIQLIRKVLGQDFLFPFLYITV